VRGVDGLGHRGGSGQPRSSAIAFRRCGAGCRKPEFDESDPAGQLADAGKQGRKPGNAGASSANRRYCAGSQAHRVGGLPTVLQTAQLLSRIAPMTEKPRIIPAACRNFAVAEAFAAYRRAAGADAAKLVTIKYAANSRIKNPMLCRQFLLCLKIMGALISLY